MLMPLTVALSEPGWRVRWYYYLSSGLVSYTRLKAALNGSSVAVHKGYLLSIPSAATLQALFEANPALELHSGSPIVRPMHFWTSTPEASGHHLALWHRMGEERTRTYAAREAQPMHVLLEVSEAFTVVNSDMKLRRMVLQDGMSCCFVSDTSQVRGVPVELSGATYFSPEELKEEYPTGGVYTVFAAMPSTVFAVAAIDPYNKHGIRYKSGFEKLGWKEVHSPHFLLSPWGIHLAAWRTELAAGQTLQVPYQRGLFGSVAVLAHAPVSPAASGGLSPPGFGGGISQRVAFGEALGTAFA